MNYAQIRHYDTANGTGIRTSVFFSGCTHNCYNCFNKEYQNFSYGNIMTENEIELICKYLKEEQVSGITLLGGEPLQQNYDEMLFFLKKIRDICDELNKNIWMYSGYTYEEILSDKNKKILVFYCDVLVDGRYKENLRNLKLKFRGSSNQRIIDIKASINNENVVLLFD